MFAILQVGLDAFVRADSSRPRFIEIVGPTKKWGGDNSDAFYQYAPIDPSRTYRVRGIKGDAVYFSLTVYGGPDDGHYSERIVASINMTDLTIGDDGFFEFILSPEQHDATPWLKLEPDAVCAITRDYLEEPATGRRLEWRIDAIDGRRRRLEADRRGSGPAVPRRGHVGARPGGHRARGAGRPEHRRRALPGADHDVRLGGRRRVLRHGQLRPGRGRGAGDRGPLARVRVLERLPLERAAAHLQLRLRDRGHGGTSRVTINGAQATYEPDGSWRLVISERDPASRTGCGPRATATA